MTANRLTLDQMRQAVDEKYSKFTVPLGGGKEYVAKNPLRLSKDVRNRMTEAQASLKEEDADVFEVFSDMLALVSETPAGHKALMKEIGDDLALLVHVFESYMEAIKAGEASASES